MRVVSYRFFTITPELEPRNYRVEFLFEINIVVGHGYLAVFGFITLYLFFYQKFYRIRHPPRLRSGGLFNFGRIHLIETQSKMRAYNRHTINSSIIFF